MKYEDLIKKLENLRTPEIELHGHRQALRMALLNSRRFRERTAMNWARVLAPIAAAVLLIAVVGFFTVIQPQLQMSRAVEIARNDPRVRALMAEYRLGIVETARNDCRVVLVTAERGPEIIEVRLQNGQAFVLLATRPVSLVLHGGDVWLAPEHGFHTVINITFPEYIPVYLEEQAAGDIWTRLVDAMALTANITFSGYIIKVDLVEERAIGFSKVEGVTALKDIKLEHIDFVQFEPSGGGP